MAFNLIKTPLLMINYFKKKLFLVYQHCLWLRYKSSSKDKSIWLFGSIQAQGYLDNAKYLFEYVHEFTEIEAVWVSRNRSLVSELKSKGFCAHYEYSQSARNYARKAKVAVITHRGCRADSDLPFYLFSEDTRIIQLWHGIGLKKTAYDDDKFSFRHNESSLKWKVVTLIKAYFFPYMDYVNKPAMVLALADNTKYNFAKAFRVNPENVKITGYPRNDVLIRSSEGQLPREKKKIIYMPTFRGGINSKFDLFSKYEFDIEKMDAFLEGEKMELVIKLHPFNYLPSDILEMLTISKNVKLLDTDVIYEVLSEYDMLITDYSSIYFDYLLLDRPIVFSPFDKERYLEEERSFYFNYNEVTPGPKAMHWNDVMGYLTMFNNDNQQFSMERKEVRDLFHKYQDTSSTRRVYETILSIAS